MNTQNKHQPQSALPGAIPRPVFDLKDAVALLRAVMAQHNVESMTITATKADMRRVVVLDQSLDD